ncbi:Ercc8 protein [Salpingoeca rosetta]|uniref:Ercc8 protein n=1 Tax=Salpingoeca rosetta (strain ATCC 50818 / BSB-021) TaxID=946362 RepID=F2UC40_SALR5|nr:Ercc8 protein [Salpingoeca rosetta]EGD74147.1 Ercc8 protein [Salpingoeca rosetta]|eukprot:XP_004993048.1 Ercc8 protein [Salpingoeca rosetta]
MDVLHRHALMRGLLPCEPWKRRLAQLAETQVELQNAHILVHRPENKKIAFLDIDRAENRYLLSAGTSKHIRIHDLEPVRRQSLGMDVPTPCDDYGDGASQSSTRSRRGRDQAEPRPMISYGGANLAQRLREEDRATRRRNRALACRVPEVAFISAGREGAHTGGIGTVQWYPQDSGMFTSSARDGNLKCWDTNELAVIEEFTGFQTLRHHAQSPVASGHELIALATGPAVVLCDLRTGMRTHSLSIHQKASTCVCWSPTSEHLLVSGTIDGQVLVWDVRRAKPCLSVLDARNNVQATARMRRAHHGAVAFAAFTPDGEHIITCGESRRKWDMRTFRNTLVHFTKDHSTSARSCAITNAHGRTLMYSAATDHTGLLVHDLETGQATTTLLGHFAAVSAVTATRTHGQPPIIVSASAIGSLALWKAPRVITHPTPDMTRHLAASMRDMDRRFPLPVRLSLEAPALHRLQRGVRPAGDIICETGTRHHSTVSSGHNDGSCNSGNAARPTSVGSEHICTSG